MKCSKCGASSGNDWEQCNGACPMEGSPHYTAALNDPVKGLEVVGWQRPNTTAVVSNYDKINAHCLGDEFRASFLKEYSIPLTDHAIASRQIAELEAEATRWRERCHDMIQNFARIEADAAKMREALEKIAEDGTPYRNGYCQTDIAVDPALTAEEAQSLARRTLQDNT